jgi:hypothetical protein
MIFRRPAHLSDATLVRAMDGELTTRRRLPAEHHLAECERCRSRLSKLQSAARQAARALDDDRAGAGFTTARLRSRLELELVAVNATWERSRWFRFRAELAAQPRTIRIGAPIALLVCLLPLFQAMYRGPRAPLGVAVVEAESLPVSAWTPGAAEPVNLTAMCAGQLSHKPAVTPSVRREVLQHYHMQHVAPQDYELDYLITPELGGLATAQNLWPERYTSRVWNARVKDDLERLLPELVCRGTIDLNTAQRDLADNWVTAYRKYFHSDEPVASSADVRDEDDERSLETWPWIAPPTPFARALVLHEHSHVAASAVRTLPQFHRAAYLMAIAWRSANRSETASNSARETLARVERIHDALD